MTVLHPGSISIFILFFIYDTLILTILHYITSAEVQYNNSATITGPSAFSSLTLLVGWQEGHPACKKTEWWGAGIVVCLERNADLHTAQLMPLPLAVSCFTKIQRLVLPFWYRLTRVVPDRGPLNRCVCVC